MSSTTRKRVKAMSIAHEHPRHDASGLFPLPPLFEAIEDPTTETKKRLESVHQDVQCV
jgi:hypothetical protein